MPINSKQAYTFLLLEINKLGNEDKMRKMLSKYMLDPQDPKFLVNLGVILLTEIRQELEDAIEWDDPEEEIAGVISKRMARWNEDEIRRADVVVKTSAELQIERDQREANKDLKAKETQAENRKRAAAKKQKNTGAILDTSKPTKVIGNIGGYAIESAI